MNMKIMKVAVLVMALAVALTSLADKIIMSSGTVLTGTVTGIKEGVIKFASDDFGDMDIDPGKVEKIEDPKQTPVPIADLKVIPKDPEVWHGSFNAAFLAARGNTYQNTWSIVANLNRRWEKDRFKADFGYYYAENAPVNEEKQRTVDRWETELQHDHFWFEKVYSYENVRYDRDMIQELEGRYRLGAGLGYQWLDGVDVGGTGKWSFNQEAGVNWVYEEYSAVNAENGGYAALRYAHHLGFLPAINEGLEFFHNLEYLPQVDDWEKYLIKADVGFTTKIIYDFDLLCKIEWDFNSQPAPDRKKGDTRYIAGLGYKW